MGGNPPPEMKDDAKMDENVAAHMNPVDPAKNTVELMSSFSDQRTVKIHQPLEKYVEFCSVKGPKGYQISGLTATFGGDLQAYGIGVGWRLLKLNDQDVTNMFTQMIKG